MSHAHDLISTDVDVEEYLRRHENKTVLRFVACGSEGDGKSTLIGRLLYEAGMLCEDELVRLEAESKAWGRQGANIDFALLLDGLAAEREQGATIDVAYRFFSTGTRRFIAADAPGREQFTRNMVTGASTADAALILVDARKGARTQTRRHSYLASLAGIRDIALVVNKMDLVGYDEAVFRSIVEDYLPFARRIGVDRVTPVPVCALKGDNVLGRSASMPWYSGPSLTDFLEAVQVDEVAGRSQPFRMSVQWLARRDPDFRGFAGTVAAGAVRTGDRVRVLPTGREATVARIVTGDGDLPCAFVGQAVMLTLGEEVAVSRGDVLAAAANPPEASDQFEATVVWMNERPMLPGRPYLLKTASSSVGATITEPKYRVNVNTLEHLAAKTLSLNDIGVCNLSLQRPITFEPYARNRRLGGFILLDPNTRETVAAGMLHFALRRASNIHVQHLEVDRAARAAIKGQRPAVLWFTGLSGAGKSTIANLVEARLQALGRHTYLLDGDNVRHGLCRDLGFTAVDRVENIRRVAEVAKLMNDAGLIVITAFISPFRAERGMARALLPDGEFLEIHVDTPLSVAEERDPKGLYRKARRGDLPNFTGIDSPYEPPEAPELRVETVGTTPQDAAERVVELLRARGFIA